MTQTQRDLIAQYTALPAFLALLIVDPCIRAAWHGAPLWLMVAVCFAFALAGLAVGVRRARQLREPPKSRDWGGYCDVLPKDREAA